MLARTVDTSPQANKITSTVKKTTSTDRFNETITNLRACFRSVWNCQSEQLLQVINSVRFNDLAFFIVKALARQHDRLSLSGMKL